MIIDLEKSGSAATEGEPYDLCIIGSGPAGATVAAELANSGLRVCVLESGRLRTSKHADALKRVQSTGILIKEYSRERVLGGASTTWAGLSSPLDRTDLEPRPWLRHSGWPISEAELTPYYAAASARYRFPPADFFGSAGFGALRSKGEPAEAAAPLTPDWGPVEEKVFLACAEPQNFAKEVRGIYERGEVDLFLDASVTELSGDPGTKRIRSAVMRSRGGREHRLHARAFVVAAGGIENARLLLNSTDLCASGLGNERDQVGRYLMNHPKSYRGMLHLDRPVEDVPYFFGCLYKGYAGYAGLRLTPERQEELQLLNSYVRMEPIFPWSDSQGIEALVLLVKKTSFVFKFWKQRHKDEVVTLRDYSETGDDSDLQNKRKGLFEWFGLLFTILFDARKVTSYLLHRLTKKKPKIKLVRLRNFMEMEPIPENRVTLSSELDDFGKPLPHAHHTCTPADRRSMTALHAALVDEFPRVGAGRLDSDLTNPEGPFEGVEAGEWPINQDASHHMGTTRMGTDPATSVVTPEGQLHTVDNVFLAGASTFPTSGSANPTFTIVALSIRLAEHLERTLGTRTGTRIGAPR